MSTSGTVEIEESQTRGRKRVHTEPDTNSPDSKRAKLPGSSLKNARNLRTRRDEERKLRELTPAEKEHEKLVKERTQKYRRGDGAKLSVCLRFHAFPV